MCGIAGIIGRLDPGSAKADVGRMLDILRRRGPDDVEPKAGIALCPGIAGFRSLT